MTIYFSNRGSITFSQYDAVEKFWKNLPECLRGMCKSSLAPENLFKAHTESQSTEKEKQDEHHYATNKCLCFSCRFTIGKWLLLHQSKLND